jgi:hypothetical protein
MANRKSNNEIKLFVTSLMNEEQDSHSSLIDALKEKIGGTKEFDDMVRLLNRIYAAKIEILDKIFQEL